MKKIWWKEAVAYQIYPRSFKDSNGDGIGDIQGIISKLDYLKAFGIDLIWISPVYESPNDDNGYDISDYQGIMSEYGTMEDFDQLLEEVHKRGMKLIMDLVINHTSDEHPWFIESRSSKENPYRDYYIWHPGVDGKEPNNWESIFHGSIWEYDELTEEYYMHVFSRKQPDLNWENEDVRKDLYKMINWWLDKGIDGFRIDAISHIKKTPGFPDLPNPENMRYVPSLDGHMNREGIHSFLEELDRETFSNYDIVTVGEANGVFPHEADEWVGEQNGKFSMIFQFDHLKLWNKGLIEELDIYALREALTQWQNGVNGIGWNALFLENHDLPRVISILGNDKELRDKTAKSFATMYFLMQGTPFIYQGQEIGMTNVKFDSIHDYDDVAIKNFYVAAREEGKPHEEIMEVIWEIGRDNSRTPMQWDSKTNAGFSTGVPWLNLNPNYKEINVEQALNDPDSIYYYYKNLIDLRKKNDVLIYGSYELILKNHDSVYAYKRTLGDREFVIFANLFERETTVQLPEEMKELELELALSNYEGVPDDMEDTLTFRPFEARVYDLRSRNS